MQKTVAVLVVKSQKVFGWLGHMPVMTWSMVQLMEVRGLDRIICITVKDFVKRVSEMLGKEKIEVIAMPDKIVKQDNANFDKWLCSADGPAADADVVAVIKPTSPFLPAAKIEGCIDVVLRNFADVSYTVQEVNAWTSWGRIQAYAEVPGCRVFAPNRVSKSNNLGRFRPITVSLIESLDITDSDNHRIAKALVADGPI